MSGWRAKLGVISVIGDSFEEYIHNNLPEGVSVTSTKLPKDHSSQDVSAAFRTFYGYNVDRILYVGNEEKDELKHINETGKNILSEDIILTSRDAIKLFFNSKNGSNDRILLISPYDEEDTLSDYGWLRIKSNVIRKSFPLSGVEDEGLRLDDATDYWKYHRIMDAIEATEDEEYDVVYIEDIELGFTDLSGRVEDSIGKKVVTTQEILLDVFLKECRIGYIKGEDYAKL